MTPAAATTPMRTSHSHGVAPDFAGRAPGRGDFGRVADGLVADGFDEEAMEFLSGPPGERGVGIG
ncbi:MAG TPA: hypothetical protein VGF22_02570, partial [Acidimicrobiales bacterium]